MTILKSIINGHWAQVSYINDIKKTRSPYRSRNELSSIVELSIDSNEIQGDSLFVGAPSIHEGTSFYVYFRNGVSATTSIPTNLGSETGTNFCELGYEVKQTDTSLVLYYYDAKSKKLVGKELYTRVRKNSGGALQFLVNKTLISGTYSCFDSTGRFTTVRFTDDGKVLGFPGYLSYYVCTDFVAGPQNNLDEMCFDMQTSNQKCFAFEIRGNTVKLFETKESKDKNLLKKGLLKYRFVKQ